MNRKEYKYQWYLKNRDRIIKNNKEYYQINKVVIAEKNKKRYYTDHDLKMEQRRKHYQEHKEKLAKDMKQYYEEHREERLKYAKKYRESHRKERNIYQRNRTKTDLKFNLNHKVSASIYKALKRNKNGYPWETFVDYGLDDLIENLTKTMPEDYTWQDYMKGKLQIDHIIPIIAFNFTKPEHIDFKRCWALDNLRLLPKKENMYKHTKLTKPFQPALSL